jgi:hypothetical protein
MWINRLWALGRETYIRLWPNPGFRIVRNGQEWRWNWHYGWRHGKVR